MYTISYINTGELVKSPKKTERFESIIKYIDNNYMNPDLSLKMISCIFFYSEKYLSSLFIKKMGTKFTTYVNTLRINYAIELIDSGMISISEIAGKCGFVDTFYFSKVFKRIIGKKPSDYIDTMKN